MEKPIWIPSKERVQNSAMCRFMGFVNERQGTRFDCYRDLYLWSVTDIAAFWGAFWEFGEVIASEGYRQVVDDPTRMPGARWFEGARLNFAENLLRYQDGRTAIVFKGEGVEPRRLS